MEAARLIAKAGGKPKRSILFCLWAGEEFGLPGSRFFVEKRQGEPRPEPVKAGGSDHAYFAMNGVPTISFDIKDPKGYDFSYNEIWHTESDTYSKSIPEYQEHTAVCIAVTLSSCSDSMIFVKSVVILSAAAFAATTTSSPSFT